MLVLGCGSRILYIILSEMYFIINHRSHCATANAEEVNLVVICVCVGTLKSNLLQAISVLHMLILEYKLKGNVGKQYFCTPLA